MATFLQKLVQTVSMNLKRVFGVILTLLGIFGIIYAAVLFVNAGGSSKQVKVLIV